MIMKKAIHWVAFFYGRFFFFLLLSISEASRFKDDFEKFLRREKLLEK